MSLRVSTCLYVSLRVSCPSRLDFLTSKFSSAQGADRQQLTEQINDLEKDLQLLRSDRFWTGFWTGSG